MERESFEEGGGEEMKSEIVKIVYQKETNHERQIVTNSNRLIVGFTECFSRISA